MQASCLVLPMLASSLEKHLDWLQLLSWAVRNTGSFGEESFVIVAWSGGWGLLA